MLFVEQQNELGLLQVPAERKINILASLKTTSEIEDELEGCNNSIPSSAWEIIPEIMMQ